MKRVPKGIESLIPKKRKKKDKEEKDYVFYVEIDKIFPNPYQPRKEFDKNSLEELAQSIKEHGILQPLIVTRVEKDNDFYYQLVAGERRFLAAKMVGLKLAPVLIKELDDRKKLELALIENLQREDLNPIDKAEALLKLQKEFNLTQEQISNIMGKSRVYITNLLRILKLPQKVQNMIRKKMLSEGHAKVLLSLKDEKQIIYFAEKVVRSNLSVRELENLVQKYTIWKPRKNKIPLQKLKDIEVKLKEIFGDDKKFKVGQEAGRIKITFYLEKESDLDEFLK
ncbi:putative chromosome-partitioning protein ParB [bacterium HR34]|nr:putative chromosome-partitioning protein ParB [bacterium HR34]